MAFHKRNPAALADRAPKWFCLAAETGSEHTQAALHLQVKMLARRFGLESHLAAIVAPLVFGDVSR